MSKETTNGVETADSKDMAEEQAELRKNAVAECGRFLDLIIPSLESATDERDRLNDTIMVINESRLTWLERLAGILDIDVRRGLFDGHIGLYWADVDGNILLEDDTENPAHEIINAGDLLKLTTTRDAAVAIAKGELEPEGETQ